jgi:hypothetical protein
MRPIPPYPKPLCEAFLNSLEGLRAPRTTSWDAIEPITRLGILTGGRMTRVEKTIASFQAHNPEAKITFIGGLENQLQHLSCFKDPRVDCIPGPISSDFEGARKLNSELLKRHITHWLGFWTSENGWTEAPVVANLLQWAPSTLLIQSPFDDLFSFERAEAQAYLNANHQAERLMNQHWQSTPVWQPLPAPKPLHNEKNSEKETAAECLDFEEFARRSE